MQELDRVFDGDDVLARLAVDLVDHRGQGRRLARTGRPGDEHQPAGEAAELLHHRWEPQLFEGGDLERDRAERASHRPTLHVDVGSESAQALDPEGEVELVLLLELDLLLLGEDRVAELLGLDR